MTEERGFKMTDLEREQSQVIYNLRKDSERLKKENKKLKHELHGLEVFKNHVGFILPENMYEQIVDETAMYLADEKDSV